MKNTLLAVTSLLALAAFGAQAEEGTKAETTHTEAAKEHSTEKQPEAAPKAEEKAPAVAGEEKKEEKKEEEAK